MEAAGLALAAPPLLIELIKQSVKAYQLFLEFESPEKSMKYFYIRLEIECQRLIQWGEDSGLLGPFTHSQLLRPSTTGQVFQNKSLLDVIEKVLGCINEDLEEINVLTEKYGAIIPNASSVEQQPTPSLLEPAPSSGIMNSLVSKKRKLQNADGPRKKRRSILSELQWAIKDKEVLDTTLGRLKDYNDSLYNLHPPEIKVTISRDAIASLVQSATYETLRDFGNLPLSTSSSSCFVSQDPFPYSTLASTANMNLTIRELRAGRSHRKNAESEVKGAASSRPRLNTNYIFDSDHFVLDDLATYDGRIVACTRNTQFNGYQCSHIFVERKFLVRSEVAYEPKDHHTLEDGGKFDMEMDKLSGLAMLLHQAGANPDFQSLKFMGICRKKSHIALLLYKLPDWANFKQTPITLRKLITPKNGDSALHLQFDSCPSLTTRFRMAKFLAQNVYQLHSASVLHKDISSLHVYFFRRLLDSEMSTTTFDLQRPFLCGIKNARGSADKSSAAGQDYQEFRVFKEGLNMHPGYFLSRWINTDSVENSYYRFRHDYYSVGLVLLEIGLWRPLHRMKVMGPTDPYHLKDMATMGHMELDWFKKAQDIAQQEYEVQEYDEWETILSNGSFKDLETFAESLSSTIKEAGLEALAASPKDHEMLQFHTSILLNYWSDLFPLALFRQSAIIHAEKLLGVLMGEKYQKLVLKCLKSEFDLPPTAPESEWRKAFNWQVMKELEECCV